MAKIKKSKTKQIKDTKVGQTQQENEIKTNTMPEILNEAVEEFKLSDTDIQKLEQSLVYKDEPTEKLTELMTNDTILEEITPTDQELHEMVTEIMDKHSETMEKLKEAEDEEKFIAQFKDFVDNSESIEIPVLYDIETAAQILINGFREHWLPGIRVRCTLQGLDTGGQYTLDTWKLLFIAWGGTGILNK